MKIYLFVFAFSLVFFSTKAQLKVLSSGEVTIPLNKSLWITNSTTPGDNGYRLRMLNNGSNAYIDYYNNLYFRSGSASSLSTVTFTSAGNVGIKTTTPYSALHVVGNSTFTQTTSSITSAAYIRGLNTYSTATTPDYTWYNNDLTGIFHPEGGNIIGISTGGVERLRINSSGNVGIGTTTPGRLLTVGGSVNPVIGYKTLDGKGWATYAKDDLNFSIFEYTNTGWSSGYDRIVVNRGGNIYLKGHVGIGDYVSSNYNLYVQGDAYATDAWEGSDERMKKDIITLDKDYYKGIFELNSYSYKFKDINSLSEISLNESDTTINETALTDHFFRLCFL